MLEINKQQPTPWSEFGGSHVNFDAEKGYSKRKTLLQIKKKINKKKQSNPYRILSFLLIFRKTKLPYDIWNYNFRKTKKRKSDKNNRIWWVWWKFQKIMAELKHHLKELKLKLMWIQKSLREMIEMFSRLDICWQSSCIYHSWILEEQSNKINVEDLLVDSEFREECRENDWTCWKDVSVGEQTL